MSDTSSNPPWWALVLLFAAMLPLLLLIRGRSANDLVKLLKHDLLTRFAGLCLVALGSGIFFLLIYHPMLQTIAKARVVPHAHGAAFLSILVVCAGSLMSAVGSRVCDLLPLPGQARTRMKSIVVTVVVVFAIAGELAYFWFLRSRGYG